MLLFWGFVKDKKLLIDVIEEFDFVCVSGRERQDWQIVQNINKGDEDRLKTGTWFFTSYFAIVLVCWRRLGDLLWNDEDEDTDYLLWKEEGEEMKVFANGTL